MKKIFALILFLFVNASGFKLIDSSTINAPEWAEIKNRMDSLEVLLEKLSRESATKNPIVSGEYAQWGSGLTVGVEYPMPSVEFGYTFQIVKQSARMGILAGYRYRVGIEDEKSWDLELAKQYFHLKFTLSSPVFLNLMSVSGSVAQMYSLDSFFDNNTTSATCTNLGFDFEFWIRKNVNLFFGLNTFLYKAYPENSYSELSFTSDSFKIGVRYFTNKKRDK